MVNVILYASFADVLLKLLQDSQSVRALLSGSVVWTICRLYFWMLLVLKVTSKHMHTQLEFVSAKSRFIVLTELNEPLYFRFFVQSSCVV